jgi:hypothetical protein
MRAVVITRHGPPEVLEVQQRPDPRPGRGEVAIEVKAAGINFADLMARLGLYRDAPKPPCVVGYEVAGVISAVGEGVEGGLEPGQRVIAPTRFGGYAKIAVSQANGVVALPDASATFAREHGLPDFSPEAMAGQPVEINEVAAGVERANSHLSRVEQIKRSSCSTVTGRPAATS